MTALRAASTLVALVTVACVRDANSATGGQPRRPAAAAVSDTPSLSSESTTVVRRLLVAGARAEIMDVSRDGSTVLLFDAGGLRLHNLTSGASRPLVASDSGWVMTARLSRDGDRVYYTRRVPPLTWDSLELRVRTVKTAEDHLIRTFTGQFSYIELGDESRNAGALFLALRAGDWTWQLARVSLRDARVTPIKSFNWRAPSAPRLSPDGRFIAYDVAPEDRTNKRDVYLLAIDGSREVQVTRTVENERLVAWSERAGLLFARDEHGSRYLWQAAVSSDGRIGAMTLVRRDMIAMSPVRLADDRLYFAVSNSAREVLSLPVVSGTSIGSGPATTVLRTLHWTEYAVSPDGSQIAYVVGGESDGNGPVSLFIRSMPDGIEREIELPLDYIWTMAWSGRPHELVAIAQKRGRDELVRIDVGTAAVAVLPGTGAPCGGELLRVLPLTSPDGETTYYYRQSSPGPDAELVACLAANREGRVLLRGALLPPAYLLAPDGKRLAVIEHRADTSVLHIIPTTSSGTPVVHRFAAGEPFSGIAGWSADGADVLVTRDRPEGAELWRVPSRADRTPSLAFRTERGRRLRYVASRERVFYTQAEGRPPELWVMEKLPAVGVADGVRPR